MVSRIDDGILPKFYAPRTVKKSATIEVYYGWKAAN
jgi:hypothetical protein